MYSRSAAVSTSARPSVAIVCAPLSLSFQEKRRRPPFFSERETRSCPQLLFSLGVSAPASTSLTRAPRLPRPLVEMHAATSTRSARASAAKAASARPHAGRPAVRHADAAAAAPPRSVATRLARSSNPPSATAEVISGPSCDLEVDAVLAKELAENGE